MSKLTIIINNFEFELIGFYLNAYANRNVIKCSSRNTLTNTIEYFYLYQSVSDMGFWRLCVEQKIKNKEGESFIGILYKGIDYIQQTFIHIDLQKFINENINHIDKIYDTDKNICSYDRNNNLSNIISHVNDTYHNIISHVNDTYHNIISHVNDTSRYNKYDILMFKEYRKNKCGSIKINNEHITEKILLKNLNDFSKKFSENFDILIDTNKKIYENYKFNKIINSIINPADTSFINFTGDIYKVKLQNKENKGIEIWLYYIHYNLTIKICSNKSKENICKIEPIKNKYSPLLLIPLSSIITKFGLYSEYIMSGNYICKLIDYRTQCSEAKTAYSQCTSEYTYIGDRYNNLFPFDIIEKDKFKRKYLKYKNKYTLLKESIFKGYSIERDSKFTRFVTGKP